MFDFRVLAFLQIHRILAKKMIKKPNKPFLDLTSTFADFDHLNEISLKSNLVFQTNKHHIFVVRIVRLIHRLHHVIDEEDCAIV